MPEERIRAAADALIDFVIRAASDKATPEEVKALPAVANALVSIQLCFRD